jgi:hypothetical protein
LGSHSNPYLLLLFQEKNSFVNLGKFPASYLHRPVAMGTIMLVSVEFHEEFHDIKLDDMAKKK